MIGWTRLVGATAWVMSASFGCAGTTPKPSTPSYFRSPPLDYGQPPRSVSDGEVVGAMQQSPDDWLLGGATNAHAGPGWSKRFGHLRFEPEEARAGYGARVEAASCPPTAAPLAPEDEEQRAALWRSWREAVRTPSLPVFASAVPEVPPEHPGFLSCNSR
ncbi:MAG TPA: hypothetical protein VMG12_15670 [Polyangiaceae bacterium]|nr:hypothetical protein [Polyangiaceae bacterium]